MSNINFDLIALSLLTAIEASKGVKDHKSGLGQNGRESQPSLGGTGTMPAQPRVHMVDESTCSSGILSPYLPQTLPQQLPAECLASY